MINDLKDENLLNILSEKEKKKIVLESLEYLNVIEHNEILKIIKKNDIHFSENSNGIFININKLSHKNLNEIILFIHFCKNNKQILKKESNLRNKIKNIVEIKKEMKHDNHNLKKKAHLNEIKKGISFKNNNSVNNSLLEYKSLNLKIEISEKYNYNQIEKIILNDLKD